MNWRKVWPVALIVTVIPTTLLLGARTFLNSGPRAIEVMDASELEVLSRIRQLQRGMSRDDAIAILGEPDEYGAFGLRPKWQVGWNPLNAYVVYFYADGAHKVVWLNVGKFSYERAL